MRAWLTPVLCCIAVAGAVGIAAAGDESASETHDYAGSLSWNEGLHYGIDVPDIVESWQAGEPRWRPLLRGDVGLRLAIDAVGLVQGGRFVDTEDDVGVRRGYLYANGSIEGMWKPLTYTFEVGAVDDRFSLRNVSLAVHEIPYAGTITIGAFDPPMSISALTSSRATPLMERGLAVDALAPGTLAGFSFANRLAPQRVTWSFGFFSEGRDADVGDSSETEARLIGRLTWLPWQRAEELFHVGLSGSWAFSASDAIRFRSRPESFFASYLVDTGEIDAGQSLIIGGESAWVHGRLSLQGEYLQAFVLRDRLDDVTFGGLYAMASWFLTPDSRTYDESAAAFGAFVPKQPVSWTKRQIGAFELALRWSYLDLADRDVRGGRAMMLMSGLNWYLNRYVRLQCNVGYASARGGPRPDDGVVLQTRIDFLI